MGWRCLGLVFMIILLYEWHGARQSVLGSEWEEKCLYKVPVHLAAQTGWRKCNFHIGDFYQLGSAWGISHTLDCCHSVLQQGDTGLSILVAVAGVSTDGWHELYSCRRWQILQDRLFKCLWEMQNGINHSYLQCHESNSCHGLHIRKRQEEGKECGEWMKSWLCNYSQNQTRGRWQPRVCLRFACE